MNNPFGNFGSDENGFEQNAVQKAAGQAVKAVTGQAAQQSKQITQDIVSQLFGADYSKGTEQPAQSPKQAQQHPTQPPPSTQSPTLPQDANHDPFSQFPGLQTPQDKSQFEEAQRKLAEEKAKAEKDKRFFTEHYYEPSFGFETKLKQQEAQKKQEKEAEKQQEEQKEEQKKMELEEKKKQESPMAIQQGQRKTEAKFGAG